MVVSAFLIGLLGDFKTGDFGDFARGDLPAGEGDLVGEGLTAVVCLVDLKPSKLPL